MVKAYRAHNVLVYNDMVVNRMTAGGDDVISHCNGNDFWGPKASSTGAPYFGLTFTYGVDNYKARPTPRVPGVCVWSAALPLRAVTQVVERRDDPQRRLTCWPVESCDGERLRPRPDCDVDR